MLDDFREQAGEADYFEEEEDAFDYEVEEPYRPRGKFLGMSPPQRFVVAVMLFVMTVILSTFCLLVSGKVVPVL